VVAAVVLWRRPKGGLDRRSASQSAVAGLLSLAATTAYFLSAQAGLLTVAAVMTSLYPGVTAALAAVVLGERPSGRQGFGLALGALAVVLVSLG